MQRFFEKPFFPLSLYYLGMLTFTRHVACTISPAQHRFFANV